MDIEKAAALLKKLKKGERKVIYESADKVEVSATRTDKIAPGDFAVGLSYPGRKEFYPTHIRLLIDLYIKRESNPKDSRNLFLALEKIFEGADPKNFVNLNKLNFPMKLDSPEVNLYYAQLLMIEQRF